jgi:hypothetical protein
MLRLGLKWALSICSVLCARQATEYGMICFDGEGDAIEDGAEMRY